MSRALNDVMEFDAVIRIAADGSAARYRGVTPVHAPELYVETDDDGQILKNHVSDMISNLESQGWDVQSGWTGQQGGGVIMHESEFIGGGVEWHIRETPGLWCAVAVYVDSEKCPNDSEACKLSDPCAICADGTGNDREQCGAGWVFMHRTRPVPAYVSLPEGDYRAPLRGTVTGPGSDDSEFRVTWSDSTLSVEQLTEDGRKWIEVTA